MRNKCRSCEHIAIQGGFCKIGQFIPCSLSGFKKYFKEKEEASKQAEPIEKPVEAIKYDEGKEDLLATIQGFILPLIEVSRIYNYGIRIYGLHNWQNLDEDRIKKAALRHLIAVCCGSPLNEEKEKDGTTITFYHAAQLAWNALALCWFAIRKTKNREVEFTEKNN